MTDDRLVLLCPKCASALPHKDEGIRFACEVVQRIVARKRPGQVLTEAFTEDIVNEALVAIGRSPINGKRIEERRA